MKERRLQTPFYCVNSQVLWKDEEAVKNAVLVDQKVSQLGMDAIFTVCSEDVSKVKNVIHRIKLAIDFTDAKPENLKKLREEGAEVIIFDDLETIFNIKNILEIVLPKILETKKESKSVVDGANGKFIVPGQSGYPTRGNINILPTGTNFYSIDPYKIPSRASWKVGVKLAEELMNRYIEDEGKLPKNIAMILYSGDTIKTNGDDIAEAL